MCAKVTEDRQMQSSPFAACYCAQTCAADVSCCGEYNLSPRWVRDDTISNQSARCLDCLPEIEVWLQQVSAAKIFDENGTVIEYEIVRPLIKEQLFVRTTSRDML